MLRAWYSSSAVQVFELQSIQASEQTLEKVFSLPTVRRMRAVSETSSKSLVIPTLRDWVFASYFFVSSWTNLVNSAPFGFVT